MVFVEVFPNPTLIALPREALFIPCTGIGTGESGHLPVNGQLYIEDVEAAGIVRAFTFSAETDPPFQVGKSPVLDGEVYLGPSERRVAGSRIRRTRDRIKLICSPGVSV